LLLLLIIVSGVNVITAVLSEYYYKYYATSRKVAGSVTDEAIGLFNLLNPSNRTMALGTTQFLTEMSTRNLSGGKGRPARKADNLTTNCEPIF
jgi:hypothetical protein